MQAKLSSSIMLYGVVVKRASLRAVLKIIIAALLGVLIGSLSGFIYYQNAKRPYTWHEDPIVVNCVGEHLTGAKIKSALDFWKSYGNNYSFIVNNPCSSNG